MGDGRADAFVLLSEQGGHQDEGDGAHTEAVNEAGRYEAREREPRSEAEWEEEAEAEAEHAEGGEAEAGEVDDARVEAVEDEGRHEVARGNRGLDRP